MIEGKERTLDNGGFSHEQRLYMGAKANYQVRREAAEREYPPTLDEQKEGQLSKSERKQRSEQRRAANKKHDVAAAAKLLQDAEILLCLWGTQQGLEVALKQQKPKEDIEALRQLVELLEQRRLSPTRVAQLIDLTMNLDPRNKDAAGEKEENVL